MGAATRQVGELQQGFRELCDHFNRMVKMPVTQAGRMGFYGDC